MTLFINLMHKSHVSLHIDESSYHESPQFMTEYTHNKRKVISSNKKYICGYTRMFIASLLVGSYITYRHKGEVK